MGAPRKLSAISLLFTVFLLPIGAATLGTVIPITGGVSDLTLDDNRNVLYLVRSLPYDRIDIFSTTQRRVLSSVPTDRNPLAAAMSRDGNFLYVVCYDAASLNIVDLRANPPAVVRKISLPARPEAVAVGADERVLITTIGSGANNLLNTLLLFDPNADQSRALSTVPDISAAGWAGGAGGAERVNVDAGRAVDYRSEQRKRDDGDGVRLPGIIGQRAAEPDHWKYGDDVIRGA
jgi:DNA-binding beta-propeller fold protein YncE